MPGVRPTDPEILATAVADSVVAAVDPGAPRSCLFLWEVARPWLESVVDRVRTSHHEEIRSLGADLLAAPADPARYHAFKKALLARHGDSATAELFEKAWEAECVNRLGYYLGTRYADDGLPQVTAEDLRQLPPVSPPAAGPEADVLIVIPFQDRNRARVRLRNLQACLLTLADQSYPRERYRIVVVESDDLPRYRGLIEPLVDEYVFAPKPGIFNKSWAVNVGVVNAAGPTEVVCVLDGDVLADREFVARNAARFAKPGTAGHLTYRNMFCLSDTSTSRAIRERLMNRAATVDPEILRGFMLRRPPGCCVWARISVFHRIGGMDERYEGWGGEDNDFAYRMDINGAFDTYHDWLLHMAHPPSSVLNEDGSLPNSAIPGLSWRPTEPIGRLDRFATAGSSGVPA
ncbi:glycosyltransferase family 2 protein [Plantactinospora sp. KBS50]|uniref:glycosyltransferase n=1 Tax=Plantactinospora sp. KBS50 TaxID=2024580 RepID=UPI000BAB2053|nr:galactosyltransferase-related protein [Plantactinospora sp. KBS50]ASW57181.1 hypothetical protein CIK06_28115 [Plantactinospora sp. KBS50]